MGRRQIGKVGGSTVWNAARSPAARALAPKRRRARAHHHEMSMQRRQSLTTVMDPFVTVQISFGAYSTRKV
jgi:hypothetical protein